MQHQSLAQDFSGFLVHRVLLDSMGLNKADHVPYWAIPFQSHILVDLRLTTEWEIIASHPARPKIDS